VNSLIQSGWRSPRKRSKTRPVEPGRVGIPVATRGRGALPLAWPAFQAKPGVDRLRSFARPDTRQALWIAARHRTMGAIETGLLSVECLKVLRRVCTLPEAQVGRRPTSLLEHSPVGSALLNPQYRAPEPISAFSTCFSQPLDHLGVVLWTLPGNPLAHIMSNAKKLYCCRSRLSRYILGQ